jgi:hypothetical protein
MVYTTHLWENWRWVIIVLPTLHIIHMLRHLPYPPCQLGTQFHHYHHPGANKRRRAFNLRQFPSKMRYTPIWPYFIVEKIQTTVPISWRKKGNIICQFHEETKSSSTIDIPDLVMGQNPGTLRYPKIAGQWMVISQKMAIGFDPPPFPTDLPFPRKRRPPLCRVRIAHAPLCSVSGGAHSPHTGLAGLAGLERPLTDGLWRRLIFQRKGGDSRAKTRCLTNQ